jgi:hypothetical protein
MKLPKASRKPSVSPTLAAAEPPWNGAEGGASPTVIWKGGGRPGASRKVRKPGAFNGLSTGNLFEGGIYCTRYEGPTINAATERTRYQDRRPRRAERRKTGNVDGGGEGGRATTRVGNIGCSAPSRQDRNDQAGAHQQHAKDQATDQDPALGKQTFSRLIHVHRVSPHSTHSLNILHTSERVVIALQGYVLPRGCNSFLEQPYSEQRALQHDLYQPASTGQG